MTYSILTYTGNVILDERQTKLFSEYDAVSALARVLLCMHGFLIVCITLYCTILLS